MATDYPLVRLKRNQQTGARIKSGKRAYFPRLIPYQDQARRLGQVFDKTAKELLGVETGTEISTDPRAVVPERAIVFELIGPVAEFELAVQSLGLEWLFSEELGEQDDEEAEEEGSADSYKAKWLYLTMPSLAGLKKLLTQWTLFKEGRNPAPEFKDLWKLFGYLSDLRGWSAKDRIDPVVISYISKTLAEHPERDVVIELDLWYRSEKERRDGALATVEEAVKEVGGTLLDAVEIPEIQYQGVLARVPAQVAREIAEGVASQGVAKLDEIMTIRPQSAFSAHHGLADAPEMPELPEAVPNTRRRIAALLDGYPIENHAALAGRLTVREIEVTGSAVPVDARSHGTGMASLIIHGDMHQPDSLTNHHLVAIPVLTGVAGVGESTPADKLPIGVIYRTLKTLVSSRDTDLKDIVVVNHSICDAYAPFIHRPSAWAALLDYFSHHHRLLFVVSAGNVYGSVQVPDFANHAQFVAATNAARQAALLNALERSKGLRTMLSPAESVNSITVGAIHDDSAPPPSSAVLDPFPNISMTNLVSGLGLGVYRGVKPDLVEGGGRIAAGCSNNPSGGVDIHAIPSAELGHLVATSSSSGDLRKVTRMAGTSNAAAMTTRASIQIADAVEETFKSDRVDWHGLKTRVPLLKALLIHTCRWGDIGAILEKSFPPADPMKWSRRRASIAKFLGYGRVDANRAISGDHNRITLLAEDEIKPEDMHRYDIPLPASMLNKREIRTVTVTLAWTTPVVLSSADCRGVGLRVVNAKGQSKFWEGVGRIVQPNISNAERGTVVHFVLEGRKLVAAAKGNSISLCVQATAKQVRHANTSVPYAMAVSMEMAQSLRSQLYSEVRAALRARVQTRA